jgi:DNA polymerase-3 subunit gamma/tau
VEADPEALQVVARRAGGSLRDAQSLLDQLLASGSPRLTVEVVHGLLGTASDERLLAILEALANHDPATTLRLVDQGVGEGVQPAELLSGIIDVVRDAMVLAIGADSLLMAITPRRRPELERIVDRWTFNSILAALQILSECRARMRGSLHGRLLVEIALAKVTQLENLTSLGPLVDRLAALESGTPRGPRPEDGLPRRRLSSTEAIAPATVEPTTTRSSFTPDPAAPRAATNAAEVEGATSLAGTGTNSTVRPQTTSSQAPPAIAAEPPPSTVVESPAWDMEIARKFWLELTTKVPKKMWRLNHVEPIAVEGPDVLIIAARPEAHSWHKSRRLCRN